MSTLAFLMTCLMPSLQDGWRDSHRVHLRNGNFLDGRLELISDKDILFRWGPGVLMRIKLIDIRGDVEEIKIRAMNSEPRRIAIRDTLPTKDPATDEAPPVRDPKKPGSSIDQFFTSLLARPDVTFEILAKEVKSLGIDGARAIVAELPHMDQKRTDLAFVSLDQMRDLQIDREIRGLLESKRADIRARAVNLLANRNSDESLRAVVGLIKDPSPAVRTAVLMALPNFNDPMVLDSISNLAIDPDPQVRARAIQSAEGLSAKVGTDNDLAYLFLSRLGRGSSGATAEIAMSLSRLADRAGEGFPVDELRDRLTGMLSDRDPAARGAAAYALSSRKLGGTSGDAIFDAFEREREPKVIVHMIDSLARLRFSRANEALIEKLRDDNKDVKAAAQRALERITGNTESGSDYDQWKEWLDKSKVQNP